MSASIATQAFYSAQGTAIFALLASPFMTNMIMKYVQNPMLILAIQSALFFVAVMALMMLTPEKKKEE